MKYNVFGKSGVTISSLGFGCMRFPMIKAGDKHIVDEDKVVEMITKAYQNGVNYFDSAYFYNDGQSENVLGKAVKGFRDKVMISTKSPGHDIKKPGDYRRILEEQLKKLDMDTIDFYHFHGIGYESFLEIDKKAGWVEEANAAKQDGLIKHISFSFHDKPENMEKLVDIGLFSSVLCQYNLVDRSNEKGIAYAKSKGLGVAVMGPLGGGRVSGLPVGIASKLGITVKSNAELALRFVFSNPNIDCALSGMETLQMLEENCTTASNGKPLSEEESQGITQMMNENEKLSKLYCTGCNYCMPCPAEVNIPYIFQMMNYLRVYGIADYAKENYSQIGISQWIEGKKADECLECGQCEAKCPQKIEIMRQLKESHGALSK